jgi:hypothetical protein
MPSKDTSGLKMDPYVYVCVHAVAHRLRSKQRLDVIDLWSIRPERGVRGYSEVYLVGWAK